MAEIIRSTYRIIEEIGRGGGGIVYLAEHLNLGKKIVLKADKRSIGTSPDILRREADVLKNLRHTYIPQVYDFFVENGVVYTAIDFIEGVSLDKPLKNGEIFSQAQVVKWAVQILEALCYLHAPVHGESRKGYVHGDIKPANLMLTSKGDICLIDFNIALALGEENLIGASPGYSSPEHYGIDYSGSSNTDSDTSTILMTDRKNSVRTEKRRRVVPDVRSDIYMTGATLYHLLSGNIPERNAKEVKPLSKEKFNPEMVRIISKAMQPDPDMRFQTAEEMLSEFEHIHENDSRAVRNRRVNRVCFAVVAVCFLLGIFSAFTGLKRIQSREHVLNLVAQSERELLDGDGQSAVEYALQAVSEKKNIFSAGYGAEAELALNNAVGTYDFSDSYRPYRTYELPSEPFAVTLSPDGKTAVFVFAYEVYIVNISDMSLVNSFPVVESALSEAVFADSDNLIFSGRDGISRYNITERKNYLIGEKALFTAVSGDGKYVAVSDKNQKSAVVYDTYTGEKCAETDFDGRQQSFVVNDIFANPHDNIFALDETGKFLAVSFDDGSLTVFDIYEPQKNMTLTVSGSGFTHFEGGFYENYFAFSATSDGESVFAVYDLISGEQTGGFSSVDSPYGVSADKNGIIVQTGNILVNIDPVTGEQKPLVNTSENIRRFATDGIHTVISGAENFSFFNESANEISSYKSTVRCDFLEISNGTALVASMDSPTVRILEFEEHRENRVLDYDSTYEHSETRVSEDFSTAVQFSYKQFRIIDADGKVTAEKTIPDTENVNDTQFIRGRGEPYLEVVYNDGKRTDYSAVSGEVTDEYTGEPPDMSLCENFETDSYLITAPLHGNAEVYDRNDGKFLCELKEDAYLTYVTQVGKSLIVQYITADGYYYGQILNEKCEVTAELPYLCDVISDRLIFDYPDGKVRYSEIYGTEQVVENLLNSEEKV